MIIEKYIFLIIPFLFLTNILAQEIEWIVYTNNDIGISNSSIMSVAEDKDGAIWFAVNKKGIVRFDMNSWTIYDTSNTTLKTNFVWTVAVDSFNNKWFGTFAGTEGGLVKYDEKDWTCYNVANHGIEGSSIFSIAFDYNNNLWMGTYWDGLAKFDGDSTWQIYNSSNSGILDLQEEINCVLIDDSSHVWYGSDSWGGGKFDMISEWTLFTREWWYIYAIDINEDNETFFGGVSDIVKYDSTPNYTTYQYGDGSWTWNLIADTNNILWIASVTDGFLKLDYSFDEEWTRIYPKGYGLDSVGCKGLTRDHYGNFWIGYNNGYLAIYNPTGIKGIVDVEDEKDDIPTKYFLSQNYPNPFNPSTTIKYTIPSNVRRETQDVRLTVYDILGREVAALVNKEQKPGNYEVEWNAHKFSSSVYYYVLSAGNFSETKKMILLK